jgi:type 1 fimbria pilin
MVASPEEISTSEPSVLFFCNTPARITFGGEADKFNSDYFRNQATGTPATNVAVAIFDL